MSVAPLRQNNAFHNDPKFGRLLLVSLLVHGLVWVAFTIDLFGTNTRPKPPIYYVDLIHKPVLNPQAGRPDPRPAKKPQAAKVKPTAQTVAPTVAKKPVKPAVKPLVKPVQSSKPKPVPKPIKAPDKSKVKAQSSINEALERIKNQAAIEDAKARVAKAIQAAAVVPADVPIGMMDGTGDEVGISALAFVQAFIQQNWALSPYLLDQSRIADVEAKATLAYSATGKLVRYRINTPSGNQQFDDSLKKAIIKSQQLPQPLPKDLELNVTFNLKNMATTRR